MECGSHRFCSTCPRTLGWLEPLDHCTTRLVGSTSNPDWYAAQHAAAPVPFQIRGGPELREAAVGVGRALLAAAARRDAASGAVVLP